MKKLKVEKLAAGERLMAYSSNCRLVMSSLRLMCRQLSLAAYQWR
jgi:hypothetical protein